MRSPSSKCWTCWALCLRPVMVLACVARAQSTAIHGRKAGPSPSILAAIATAASVATLPERNSTCGLPSMI